MNKRQYIMSKVRFLAAETGRFAIRNAGIAFVLALVVALTFTLSTLATEQANKRLLEADAYELVATNPVPTIVCVDNKIILWNPSMEFLTGHSANEMVGQLTTVMVPDEFDERHMHGVERVSNGPGFGRGHIYVQMPIETAFWGTQKILATVSHVRKHDGTVIMTARFEGALMHPSIRWRDVATGEFMRVKHTVTPEKKPEKKPEEKPESWLERG